MRYECEHTGGGNKRYCWVEHPQGLAVSDGSVGQAHVDACLMPDLRATQQSLEA